MPTPLTRRTAWPTSYRDLAVVWALALVVLLLAASAKAQEGTGLTWSPRTQRLTVADGLPDQTVYSVQRDRRGFLWLGTTAGAVRYDGRQFQTLRHDPDDANSISHDNASLLFIDASGLLWIGTWGGGLNRVDLDSGEVTRWRHQAGDASSLASNYVQHVFQDRRGRLWFGTGAGLMGWRNNQLVRAYTDGEGAMALSDRRIWSIAEGREGQLWLATSTGLVEFQPDTGESRVHRTGIDGGNAVELIRLVHVDDAGRLWLAGGTQFGRFDPGPGAFHPVTMPVAQPLDRLTVNTAVRMDERHVWLGTWSGVWLLDCERSELVTIGRSGQHQWFASDDVRGLLLDPSGILWAATRVNGLVRTELQAPRQRLYSRELRELDHAYDSPLVRAIYQGAGQLWLNTDSALVRGDIDRGQFSPITVTRGLRAGRYGPSAFDDSGGIWLATLLGPARLDIASGGLVMRPEALQAAGIRDANLSFVQRDKDQRLWWATQREGVFSTDLNGRLLRHYPAGQGRPGDLGDSAPTCWLQDRRGRIWLCGDQGLSRLRADESGFDTFRHDPKDPNSLSHNRVISLLQDSLGTLWIGTQNGLNRWDEATGSIRRYPPLDAARLPIEAIAEGRSGELWLATSGRLQRFDIGQGGYVGAPLEVGEPGMAFFAGAALRLDARRLLFGSNRGLLLFDPEQDRAASFLPPIAITAAWIDRQAVPLRPGTVIGKQLRLPPGTQTLELQLAALDLRDPARNRFSYQLEGFDADWIDAGVQGHATYTNLTPGKYRFRARAAGADRLWNDAGISLEIDVLPPWWRDWRIQAPIAISLVLTLVVGIRLHLRRVSAREAQLERLIEERSGLVARQQTLLAMQDKMASLGTLTAGVAHEINNPTNFAYAGVQNLDVELNEFQSDITRLAGDDAEPEVLDFIGTRFQRLHQHTDVIRDGATRIRTIVGHLRNFTRHDESAMQSASVDDGLRATVALVKAQFGDQIHFELELGNCAAMECRPAELNQVFMNLLVNACQAIQGRSGADAGTVRVHSYQSDAAVVIDIEDNGPGIDPAHLARVFEPFYTTKSVGEGTGLGLSISYAIVERHGGQLTVESQLGHGTRMRVSLPRQSPAKG